jgi:hypothetical protein
VRSQDFGGKVTVNHLMMRFQILSVWLLILFHAICLSLQNPESPDGLTRMDFFAFGPENNDSSLPHGDDQVASQDFLSPFFFYGQTYTSFGVSVE